MMVFDDLEQEIVFCLHSCSGLLLENIVLVIKKNVWNSKLKDKNLQKKIRSQEQFIQTVIVPG